MAFDLVQYFAEQIKIQKPQLLSQLQAVERTAHIEEINALTLGKIISLWRKDDDALYQEILSQDHLYSQEIARHLTTSPQNKSDLEQTILESATTEILELQFAELKQLDTAGSLGKRGLRELVIGQIEHLSGQAKDWVWSTNELTELIGSQPTVQEEISLDETMKEFNQMVNVQTTDTHADHPEVTVVETVQPTWAKVAEPVVALVVLYILFEAVSKVFA
ncbi:hypothetical protein P7L54_09745 [Acinetobacter bereziniae]|uniref:Uncharacterized protein n=1 Tax=Acinetobacter bereziniae LMG 1003 = CIP 70.12 TaxID=981324 RepID=N9EGE3_ACIBZ|nr:hypothetical protein [Acinetobacter bereziniae]ENV91798.1 hypothetical protein F938_03265 [Acinetobacter bereziniae LMG 1003 = CIP 70.12]MBJ8552264.1 hypothetical protein [Acinetobacter bereziniae]MBJ9906624.1 hypothetical protein [Acinetobacter bereziniae]MBJ9928126.1 hypothetical protein [Acinetobacter bereziniae]MCU4436426.1 hypothetical protein [Acinetobacter bereziniae]